MSSLEVWIFGVCLITEGEQVDFSEQMDKQLGQVVAMDASLEERLARYRATQVGNYPDLHELYDQLTARIEKAISDRTAPHVGDTLPDFTLPDHDGRLVSLSDLLKSGPTLVSFNRGHWCNYCRLELLALRSVYQTLTGLGAGIVCIVPERQSYASQLKAENDLPFPVLSDIGNAFSLELGLTIYIGEELQKRYLEFDLDLARFQNSDGLFLPIPATYLIDRDGTILACNIHADFRDRTDPRNLIDMIANVS